VTWWLCQDTGCLKNGLDFCPTNVCGDSTRDSNRHVLQPLDGSQPPTLYTTNISGDLPTSIFSSLISSVALSAAFPSVYIPPPQPHACTFMCTRNKHSWPYFSPVYTFTSTRKTARRLAMLVQIYPSLIPVRNDDTGYKHLIHFDIWLAVHHSITFLLLPT